MTLGRLHIKHLGALYEGLDLWEAILLRLEVADALNLDARLLMYEYKVLGCSQSSAAMITYITGRQLADQLPLGFGALESRRILIKHLGNAVFKAATLYAHIEVVFVSTREHLEVGLTCLVRDGNSLTEEDGGTVHEVVHHVFLDRHERLLV